MPTTQIIFKASDYSTREDLENAIKQQFDLTPDTKPDVKIEGTQRELKNIQLDKDCIVFGIKVTETDLNSKDPQKGKSAVKNDKPERGINKIK